MKNSTNFNKSDLFFSNLVHEIRTPVQTIISTLDLLKDTKLDNVQKDYVEDMKYSSEILLTLVNDILDLSKISSNNLKLENISFNPISLVENTVMNESLEASDKKIELFTDIDYYLYPEILGDPTRIRQILLNLLKNAIKFTNEGFVKVELKKIGENLRFSVYDSGIGISSDFKKRIFTDFSQSDNSFTRKFGGTGLGLSICKNLVKLMNGKIDFYDNKPKGSVFYFEIPYKKSNVVTEKIYSLSYKRDIKILIVDEKLILAENLKEKLKILNLMNVEIIPDSKKALENIKIQNKNKTPYDFVFISKENVQESCWDFASNIRDFLGLRKIKLFLLIYKNRIEKSEKIKILNWFNSFIYKPIQMENLYLSLKEAETSDKTSSIKELLYDSSDNFMQNSLIGLGLKILVAEDHPVNRRLLIAFLKNYGAQVLEAENGEEVVKIAEKNPDLHIIFMDVQMPIMTGVEAANIIKKNNHKAIIIFCSANSEKELKEKYKELSSNDILPKPFKRDDVKKIVEKWKSVIFLPEIQENSNDDKIQIWNILDFEDTISHDKILGSQILFDYQEQTENFIKEAKVSIQNKDFEKLRMLTHNLEGSSSAISADGIKILAKKMNKFAHNKDLSSLELALNEIKYIYGIFYKLCESWKKEIV